MCVSSNYRLRLLLITHSLRFQRILRLFHAASLGSQQHQTPQTLHTLSWLIGAKPIKIEVNTRSDDWLNFTMVELIKMTPSDKITAVEYWCVRNARCVLISAQREGGWCMIPLSLTLLWFIMISHDMMDLWGYNVISCMCTSWWRYGSLV